MNAMNEQIKFTDGSAYERYMGIWSRLAGERFLDWLAAADGLSWLDIGCGNGAFTEMLAGQCAPGSLLGIDPSEEQLAYARTRPLLADAAFHLGDAMALPFPDAVFDMAIMPLVIFFVPDPARGVAEMVRVVAPGGTVAAYGWDLKGGGFPYEVVRNEMHEMGISLAEPPSPHAAGLETLRALWLDAGLHAVETREITVQRSFNSFEDYWATVLGGASMAPRLAAMTEDEIEELQTRVRVLLPADEEGHIACTGRANAVKGIRQ